MDQTQLEWWLRWLPVITALSAIGGGLVTAFATLGAMRPSRPRLKRLPQTCGSQGRLPPPIFAKPGKTNGGGRLAGLGGESPSGDLALSSRRIHSPVEAETLSPPFVCEVS